MHIRSKEHSREKSTIHARTFGGTRWVRRSIPRCAPRLYATAMPNILTYTKLVTTNSSAEEKDLLKKYRLNTLIKFTTVIKASSKTIQISSNLSHIFAISTIALDLLFLFLGVGY